MTGTAFVYALLDNGKPCYVGHSKDVPKRVTGHWRKKLWTARYNPGLSSWLCSLDKAPEYRIIAQVAHADRIKWEAFYTDRLRANGFALLNIASGSRLPPERMAPVLAAAVSPDALAKRGATWSGRHSGENNPRYGKHYSPETRAKIGAAHSLPEIRASKSAKMRAWWAEKRKVA